MIATVAAVRLSVMPLLPLASSSKILAPRWGTAPLAQPGGSGSPCCSRSCHLRIGCCYFRLLRFDCSLCRPCLFETGSVVRFWLGRRNATGKSADRGRHLSTDGV